MGIFWDIYIYLCNQPTINCMGVSEHASYSPSHGHFTMGKTMMSHGILENHPQLEVAVGLPPMSNIDRQDSP